MESEPKKVPPRRIFLDTCTVNFILDHEECIHELIEPDPTLTDRDYADIKALQGIFGTGQRASWELAVSPHTYHEVVSTRDPNRSNTLQGWFLEIWGYWREFLRSSKDLPSFSEAEETRIAMLCSGGLDFLPDLADRVLMIDAVLYRCDAFCTRDWSTILKHRELLDDLPLKIITPREWWDAIEPWAGLYN